MDFKNIYKLLLDRNTLQKAKNIIYDLFVFGSIDVLIIPLLFISGGKM